MIQSVSDPLQLLHDDAAADLLLELVGAQRRILHVEHLAVARLADELPVLLERRQRLDARDDFLIARLDPELVGLGERRLFFDQPLEDPLVDAELLEQPLVHVAAVGVAVGLHLLEVDAAEAVDGDLAPVDAGDDLAGAGRLAGLLAGRECRER